MKPKIWNEIDINGLLGKVLNETLSRFYLWETKVNAIIVCQINNKTGSKVID